MGDSLRSEYNLSGKEKTETQTIPNIAAPLYIEPERFQPERLQTVAPVGAPKGCFSDLRPDPVLLPERVWHCSFGAA